MKNLPRTLAVLAIATFGTVAVYGTNGMNMEGYSAASTALGGAGVAIDTGTAAPMNNPATLLLMTRESRLDLALGRLGPKVSTELPGLQNCESASDEFYMPSFGYVRRKGDTVYGISLFGQGGMGTEFAGSGFMGLEKGLVNMTEVSVGRLMLPFATRVNERLGIGGSVDFVWAGMDLCMAMTGEQLMDLANPQSQRMGTADGSLLQALQGAQPEFAYFDFTNGNAFTGKARGYGYAANLGIIYDISPEFRLGAVYHSSTSIGDLRTDSATATVGASSPMGYMEMALEGEMSVVDFQWPATYAAGFSYLAGPNWTVVGEVKQIEWSSVMDSFRMRFVANDDPGNGPLGGSDLSAQLYQHWNDQTVYAVGLEYATAEKGVYRVGFNHASNPIPDAYLNPLFPATVEDHITFGSEHRIRRDSQISWSGAIGLENEVRMPNGLVSRHRQYNLQIMFTRFWGE